MRWVNGGDPIRPDKSSDQNFHESVSLLHSRMSRVPPAPLTPAAKNLTGYESSVCYRATRPYQNPAANSTSAHAAVNPIKNGEGNMNHAATAAAADSAPLR